MPQARVFFRTSPLDKGTERVTSTLPLGAERRADDSAGGGGAYDVEASDLVHAEYGYNALKVVLRSHPHVAKRYFADLLA